MRVCTNADWRSARHFVPLYRSANVPGHPYRYPFEFFSHTGDRHHQYRARLELWFDLDCDGRHG